jgi:hypothetical protein
MYSRPSPRQLPYRKARDAPKPAIDEATLWPDEGSDIDPEYDPREDESSEESVDESLECTDESDGE